MLQRYLKSHIIKDALKDHKIAFITGPRQVGKTTLAQSILKAQGSNNSYYTWDDDEFRKIWLRSPKTILENSPSQTIGLDEIHKDHKWKNKLKGLYDLYKEKTQFIITGSARLDYYRKSGDSLQGRYLPFRVHPFTLCESNELKPPPKLDWLENSTAPICALEDLQNLSGFPEPLWSQNANKAARWRRLYRERLVREDSRDLQNVREINLLDSLSLLLPDRVGAPLSYESLRQDLSCSHESIQRWIELLEALYYCYRIRPYSKNVKYSLKKEPKLFMYDWSLPQSEGARWENLIAGHLIKNTHAWTDAAFGEFQLYYLRDKQKREVDFLMTKNNQPYLLVEVKSNSTELSSSLHYFHNLLKPKFTFQITQSPKKEKARLLDAPGIQIISAARFLSALN